MNQEVNPQYDPLSYFTVTANDVYLRRGPGTDFIDIGLLQKGDQVQMVKSTTEGYEGKYSVTRGGHTWLSVTVRSGSVRGQGWVATEYLEQNERP